MDIEVLDRGLSRSDRAGAEQDTADGTTESGLAATHETAGALGERPVSQIRSALGLSRRDFSRLTGFSERAIAGWESGERPSAPSRQRLQEIHELEKALAGVMQPDRIGPWLLQPNSAFQGLKPLEVIERGEIHRLWSMIFYLQSGVPS